MDAMDILEALGPIRDTYILSAREVRRKKKPRRMPYALAAILALAILCTVLLQTPMGVAAVEAVKEAVTNVIERLFPPKDVIVDLEGEPTAIAHEAQGQEPQGEVPGFAIYVDTSGYEMIEEAGSTYIRPLIFDDSLPKCEMEITHIPGKSAQSASRDHREEVSALWDYVGELQWTDRPLAWVFTLWQDGGWDARREDHYFVDDNQGGTYHITSRCFLEASEGHGTRFAAMIQSFQVVPHQDVGAATVEEIPPTEADGSDAQLRAYRDALQNLYTCYVLPGGYDVGYDGISELSINKFAIYDIDGDGSQELIVAYSTTYNAGNTFAVYNYDETTDSLKEELLEYISVSVEESGYLIAWASHAHGLGGGEILWPYTVYRYAPATDIYEHIARVDTWEKQYYPQDASGTPFPDDLDSDGDGVVYLLYFPDAETPDILDGDAFRQWERDYRTIDKDLPWVSLTMQNIQTLDG